MLRDFRSKIAAASAVAVVAASSTLLAGLAGASPSSPRTVMTPKVANCSMDQWKIHVGPGTSKFLMEGRTVMFPIIFTNTGSTCAVFGVPLIHAVSGKLHHRVGPAAVNKSMGQMAARHVVTTGSSVSVSYSNSLYFSLATCKVTDTDGLVVSIPKFVKHTYLPMSLPVCVGSAGQTTQLLSPGTHG